MAQALGIVNIVWNGQKMAVEKGSTFQNGGLQQKAVVNGKQIDYADEMVAGKAMCTKRLLRGDSLFGIWTTGTGELQMQCDTGQTYVIPDAFLTNTVNWTGGEGGKVKMEWAFGIATELLNG
jgi:hypothetical protein